MLDAGQLGLYEPTLNGLSDGVLWTDASGTIIYGNSSAGQWLGARGDSLPGKSINDFVDDGILDAWLNGGEANAGLAAAVTVKLSNGHSVSMCVVASVSVSTNHYKCFLIKDKGDEEQDSGQMLRILSEGTASVVGGDFFRSLAYHVIVSTGIRYAIVTECANEARTRVRTLVYIEHDHFLDNFEYDLVGTPCEIVMKGENFYCTADLDALFPKDEGVKSYFGVPIFLSNGEVIGHIAIFDTKPLAISEKKLNILKIFASRAGAEIERKRKDEQIQDNMLRYQSLFEDSPIGLCEEDFSDVKRYIESLKISKRISLASIFQGHPDEITNCYHKVKRLRANKSQARLFDLDTQQEYFDYLSNRFMPEAFKDLIIAYDQGELVFEREIEVKSVTGQQKILKVKRVLVPEFEADWSKTILSCVDITQQKATQVSLNQALEEVRGLKERLEAENIYLQQEIKQEHNFDEIVSQGEVFKKVLEKINQVADTDATVLILGESGTGKELIARAIHHIGKRSGRPLVKVNCAALPSALIESELFGHEKGAFTGAISQKIGRFELADGGTIFLDEIGEMPLDLQSKLLRVLQEGEFERVGGTKTIKINVRVIAATNRDLHGSIASKEFRADLYYRLNVFPISSPALRERQEDIPILVSHFCKKYAVKLGRKVDSIPKAVMDALLAYDWPGNVRELENIIERGIIVAKSNVLEMGDWLPMVSHRITPPDSGMAPKSVESDDEIASLENLERRHIVEVLNKVHWKIRGEKGAAKILSINPTTLEARMKRLGIRKP